MPSLHDTVFLAERSVQSVCGEFQLAIESVVVHRGGIDVEVKWSIRHLEHREEQTFTLQFCDPLLVRCGYSPVKELEQDRIAKELLETLDVEYNKKEHTVAFTFIENGFDIGNQIVWCDDLNLFVQCL